ncbi:27466_t:CDS:2, partial [Racocetra persica]
LGKNAIDLAIHIWYSMIVTGQQWDKCIEIFIKLLHGKLDLQMRKDFLFEFGKLRIYTHFSPKTWDCLARMLLNRLLTPGERICFDHFHRIGLLLPYWVLNAHHNTQNKFILDQNYGWVMNDSSDPLSGWDILNVDQVNHGTANDD